MKPKKIAHGRTFANFNSHITQGDETPAHFWLARRQNERQTAMCCRSRKSSGVSVECDKESKSGVKNPFQGTNGGSE